MENRLRKATFLSFSKTASECHFLGLYCYCLCSYVRYCIDSRMPLIRTNLPCVTVNFELNSFVDNNLPERSSSQFLRELSSRAADRSNPPATQDIRHVGTGKSLITRSSTLMHWCDSLANSLNLN